MNHYLGHQLLRWAATAMPQSPSAPPGAGGRERLDGRRPIVAELLRRTGLLDVALGLVLTAFVTIAGGASAAPCTNCTLYTTTGLNLRSGPSTSSSVILVMPKGSQVLTVGGFENGYAKVKYQHNVGWAYVDYLASSGPNNPGDDPNVIGSAVATTSLNLRAGPGTNHQILRVIPHGARVEITDFAASGCRYVIYDGQAGWAADQYLDREGGGQPGWTLTATVDLNLRTGPSTNDAVLLVIPDGATVQATDQLANGYRQVVYNGTTGWAYNSYLA